MRQRQVVGAAAAVGGVVSGGSGGSSEASGGGIIKTRHCSVNGCECTGVKPGAETCQT